MASSSTTSEELRPCMACANILDSRCHSTTSKNANCPVCLGVFSSDDFTNALLSAIRCAVQPYSSSFVKFSRTTTHPQLILPGDLIYRFQYFCGLPDKRSNKSEGHYETSLEVFGQKLKERAKQVLLDCLHKVEQEAGDSSRLSVYGDYEDDPEEMGCLGLHVIAVPKDIHRPSSIKTSKKRKFSHRRRHYDAVSQGGDPRVNLEQRLEKQHTLLWPINQALQETTNQYDTAQVTEEETQLLMSVQGSLTTHWDFYATIWRRPFYLRSMYTKTLRDVSQTPFFVVDNHRKRRLGVTSVEEQIVPVVTRFCGGVSTLNNNEDDNNVFGMVKFHASGREDMDVRMLLPVSEIEVSIDKKDKTAPTITGRPFVLEIYDAFLIPEPCALLEIEREVNHFTKDNEEPDPRSYGCNPWGVGIAPLKLVSSSSFKQLQAETEDKIKHYGCLCWSHEILPATDELLNKQLGTFPLEIRQQTPLRVLHRRANIIRLRSILHCRGFRVDDHNFRLHLSTSAGTYVKEFVHGDLGRTIPCVAQLLSKTNHTDILELDCEGIQY